MCRFMVFVSGQRPVLLADLIVYPAHSIINQSSRSLQRSEGNLNGDGFGVGWYTRHLLQPTAPSSKPTPLMPTSPLSPSKPSTAVPHSPTEPSAVAPAAAAPSPSSSTVAFVDAPEPLCPFGASQNPCVFNSVTPAWNNQNLYRISSKISSSLVFAHVR
ncbi:MAG: hypothetical protein Q8P67_02900, partial [archaeon]|nr:hypothetical protein [archaeon]